MRHLRIILTAVATAVLAFAVYPVPATAQSPYVGQSPPDVDFRSLGFGPSAGSAGDATTGDSAPEPDVAAAGVGDVEVLGIQISRDALPITGEDVRGSAVMGLALIAGGAALLLLRRRGAASVA